MPVIVGELRRSVDLVAAAVIQLIRFTSRKWARSSACAVVAVFKSGFALRDIALAANAGSGNDVGRIQTVVAATTAVVDVRTSVRHARCLSAALGPAWLALALSVLGGALLVKIGGAVAGADVLTCRAEVLTVADAGEGRHGARSVAAASVRAASRSGGDLL